VRDAWRDRYVLPWLSIRVVAKGFAGTRLGRWWLVLRPALELGGMALLFGAVFNAPSDGLPYFLFLLSGMVGWRFFQMSMLFGSKSLQYFRRHARGLSFAPLLVPIGASAVGVVDLAIHGTILAGTLAYFAVTDQSYLNLAPELALAPVALALMLVLAWGVSFWLSIVIGHVLDVRVLLRYIIQLWLLVTPVVYPLSFVPDGLHDAALVNPMTPLVMLFRWSLVGSGDVPVGSLIGCLVFIAVLVGGGIWFFSKQFWDALAAMSRTGDDEDDY
jgi:lipopolysaccharide transport system permease protein